METSVLTGATVIVVVSGPVTDEQVLGALGKKVTDKAERIAVVRESRGLRVMRWLR